MGHDGQCVEPVAACSCLFNWSSSKTHARLNAPVIPFAFCSPSSHYGSSRRRFPRSADLFLDLRCRNKILFTQKGETQMANNTKTATPKTQEPKAEAAANRKPIHEIRMGRIKAAIWQNETDNGIRYNVTVGRLYKDGNDWKQTESFGRDDLPVLAKVADQAHTFIFQKQQEPE